MTLNPDQIAREAVASFQSRVQPWMLACFGPDISADIVERCDRFIEEAFEIVQSLNYDPARIEALKNYVYTRPTGEPAQEVGGVMVTLAALCLAADLDMHQAGETELARIWTKVEKIRAKQAAKPTGSALPIAVAADGASRPAGEVAVKPLVWAENGIRAWRARSIAGDYRVYELSAPLPKPAGWTGPDDYSHDADTLEAAKAAAQLDYDQRIRSALVAAPPASRDERGETVDWVSCPICGEEDMRQTTDAEGHSLIHCVNSGCASNNPAEPAAAQPVEGLVGRLTERRKLRFMGDCKCGQCQLVPVGLIDEAITALSALRAEVERLTLLCIDENNKRRAEGDAAEARAEKAEAEVAERDAEIGRLRDVLECIGTPGPGATSLREVKSFARAALKQGGE